MLTAVATETLGWARLINGRVNFGKHPWQVEADSAVALSPDGKWAATASRDGVVRVWHERRNVSTLDLELPALELAFSADNQWFALGTASTVNLYRLPTLELYSGWDVPHSPRCLAVREGMVAAGLGNGQVWSASRAGTQFYDRSDRPLIAIAWLNDEPVSGAKDGSVWIGQRELLGPNGVHVYSVAVYPQDNLIACASDQVRVFQANDGKLLNSWPAKADALGFAPDGTLFGLLSGREELAPFRVSTDVGRSLGISQNDGPGVIVFSQDGSLLAATCYHRIDVWQVEPLKRIAQIEVPGGIGRLEFVDGMMLALLDDPPQILTFNLPGLELAERQELTARPEGAIISRGLGLWSSQGDINLRLWDFNKEPPVELCTLPQYRALKLESSKDGRFLAATTHQAGVALPIDLYVWDLEESSQPTHLGEFRSLCGPVFSERGLEVINRGRLRGWELGSWSPLGARELPQSLAYVSCLASLPDGKLLADEHLLDPSNGSASPILGFEDRVVDLAASPDGNWVAVNFADKGMFLCPMPTPQYSQ